MADPADLLSPAERALLEAIARRMIPHVPAGVDLVGRIEARLAGAPAERARDVRLALSVFGSRAASAVVAGVARPFARLSPEGQDRVLARWGGSRLPLARTVYAGLRRLVVAVYYSLPESFADIGYLGPLHLRTPAFPWEGPVPGGAPNEDEPVARGVEPGARGSGFGIPHPRDATSRSSMPGQASPESRGPSSDPRPSADVIVIGSGAGGAVAAARLAEAGRDVLLIEEGSCVERDELTELEGDTTARLYAEGGFRATDDLSFVLLQGAAVGGGTLVNWMITFRAPDFVLDEWADRLGITGFSPAEMAPAFERVEREIHLAAVPDDAHSPNNRILLRGASALGWRVGGAKINARGCIRSGFCGQGCRYGAKQSVDAVYVPRALAAGTRLLADTRVDRIEIVERGGTASVLGARGTPPLKRVHATVLDRRTRRPAGGVIAEAPVVVLAAGAVGTPLLLARSGLGGGGVGRYLRLHPTTAVAALYDDEVYAAAGIPQSAVCDQFLRRDENGYGFWIECAPHHPALGAVATPGFGVAHRDLMRQFRRTANLIVLVRDGADLDRSNGAVRLGRNGRASITYRLGPRDRRHLIDGVEAAARIHLAAGASEVRTLHTVPCVMRADRDLAELRRRRYGPNEIGMFSAHVNGTCRLGTDPRRSGAAPSGERHGVRGLYIADGSLLPTGLGVNPQATIMAMATLIVERM